MIQPSFLVRSCSTMEFRLIILIFIVNRLPSTLSARYSCKQYKDAGPCHQYALRWYYDRAKDDCFQFYYGGCLGNTNRYLTKNSCIRNCVHKPQDQGIPSFCLLPRDPGYCSDNRQGFWWWYFDAEKGKCRQFYHQGCTRNHNRFASLAQCQKVCGQRLMSEAEQCARCDKQKSECKAISKFNYNCECKKGYVKNLHNGKCEDLDECRVNKTNACHRFAWCMNTDGSYRCTCMAGYRGDGITCTYVGLGSSTLDCSKCHKKATCEQGICQCKPGFQGNGLNCTDVDECLDLKYPCDNKAMCKNTPGSFYCMCPEGFAGNGYSCSTDVKSCLDKFYTGYKEDCGLDFSRPWEEVYYFSHDTKTCTLFWHNGCNGTSRNIFSDLATCEKMCERTQVLSRAQVCWDSFDKNYMNQCHLGMWEPRYFFDQDTFTCKQFWYGQCQGSSRNFFVDMVSCQWLCEVQPQYLSRACLDSFDTRYKDQCSGGRWQIRYYYDNSTQNCVGFWYDGCTSKSQNLFPDLKTCRYLCQEPAAKAMRHAKKHGTKYWLNGSKQPAKANELNKSKQHGKINSPNKSKKPVKPSSHNESGRTTKPKKENFSSSKGLQKHKKPETVRSEIKHTGEINSLNQSKKPVKTNSPNESKKFTKSNEEKLSSNTRLQKHKKPETAQHGMSQSKLVPEASKNGKNLAQTDDPCISEPCQHGGTCKPEGQKGKYHCNCNNGYSGPNCEKPVNESPKKPVPKDAKHCMASPCLNGGSCIGEKGSASYCKCPKGYMGKRCQLEISPVPPTAARNVTAVPMVRPTRKPIQRPKPQPRNDTNDDSSNQQDQTSTEKIVKTDNGIAQQACKNGFLVIVCYVALCWHLVHLAC